MARDRIDVHAHYIPETYRDALVAAGQAHPDGIPALPASTSRARLPIASAASSWWQGVQRYGGDLAGGILWPDRTCNVRRRTRPRVI